MTISAKFEIEHVQFLNHQCEVQQPLPPFAQDSQQLIHLYQAMVLTRAFDAKAVALQRTGKMGTFPSSLGQEAVSVGIGSAMQASDVLCASYREQGAQLLRGIKMHEIFMYWGGDERGNHYANNKEDFPICVPIGTQTLHAVGVASAFKIRHQSRAAVTVCGDGGTSQGDVYEAINLAGAWQLPIVFVINNNQWAISVPRHTQSHCQTLAQKAIAGGFSGIQVDGNDVIAVRHVMEQALAKARRGGGPTLIETITYRLSDHTTADDANRYRSSEEVKDAWEKDPILRLKNYLSQQGHWNDAQEQILLNDCAMQIDQAVQHYLNISPESITAIFDDTYANLPESLLEQREAALALGVSHHE